MSTSRQLALNPQRREISILSCLRAAKRARPGESSARIRLCRHQRDLDLPGRDQVMLDLLHDYHAKGSTGVSGRSA